MTRFTLVLLGRSGRWVPPAAVYLVWLVLVVANPGPALSNGANMFFATVVVSVWLAIVTGNVDDGPHRDLCAAVAGSPARLHVCRAGAAATLGVALALVTAVVTATTGPLGHHDLGVTVVGSAALLVAGVFLGCGIGVFLHRPVLDSIAWSLVIAAAAVIGVALLPPVHEVLRHLDHGSLRGVVGFVAIAAVVAAGAVGASAWLAGRRS